MELETNAKCKELNVQLKRHSHFPFAGKLTQRAALQSLVGYSLHIPFIKWRMKEENKWNRISKKEICVMKRKKRKKK